MGKLLSDRGIRPRGKRLGFVAGFWLDYSCLQPTNPVRYQKNRPTNYRHENTSHQQRTPLSGLR